MISSCLHLIETVYTKYGILHVHRNCTRNTTDDTSGAGNTYPYGAPRGFTEVGIAQSVLVCVVNRSYSAILATLQITSYVDSRNSSSIVCWKLIIYKPNKNIVHENPIWKTY